MTKKTTRFERIMIKIIVLHMIFLLVSQWLLMSEAISFQLNKTFLYEGVFLESKTKIVETLDQ